MHSSWRPRTSYGNSHWLLPTKSQIIGLILNNYQYHQLFLTQSNVRQEFNPPLQARAAPQPWYLHCWAQSRLLSCGVVCGSLSGCLVQLPAFTDTLSITLSNTFSSSAFLGPGCFDDLVSSLILAPGLEKWMLPTCLEPTGYFTINSIPIVSSKTTWYFQPELIFAIVSFPLCFP